ncbi:MAG: metabolite traffic protein EboE [Planctomycetota bacterium]|nr:metabolite traffic protein EboE [Planctomycetota bacterium]
MIELKFARQTIGYCTNVHAGVDLQSIRANLERYAASARIACGLDELGVGLWLPSQAAVELSTQADDFAEFLLQRRLRAYTINGFPYDNFHQDVVKRAVYQPAWWQPERLEYTQRLANILTRLLPEDEELGSISTLPIGWPSDCGNDSMLDQAGANLRQLANYLHQLELTTGRRIVVAIEPEPGCILDSAEDIIDWFDKYLPDEVHRRYLTVCHDICHSAVMMEPQLEVLGRYAEASITIGKVQVSSAIVVDWQSMAADRCLEALGQLQQFAEDRYLHQTGQQLAGGQFKLADDLPDLLADHPISEQAAGDLGEATARDPVSGDERWVVHFHVPIFLERFGHLSTSQPAVLECVRALLSENSTNDFTGHLEIETYAWSVLPAAMRKRGLAEDIAQEITWFRRTLLECL